MSEVEFFCDKSLGEENIVGFEKDGYKWYLNSRYIDDAVANAWLEQIEGKDSVNLFVIFGMANGSYIRKLKEKFIDSLVLVYEPNEKLFEYVCDMQENEVLKDVPNLVMMSDIDNFFAFIAASVNDLNYKHIKYYILPNYDKVYRLEAVKTEHLLAKITQQTVFHRNTELRFEEMAGKNYFHNMVDAFSNNTVADLIKEMRKYSDRPAILVAAGPSLNKNVDMLKLAKNKAFIICVDSALRTLAANEIVPDMVVTIDPNKSVKRFDLDIIQGVPLLCDIYYNYRIKDVYKCRRFFAFTTTSYMGKRLESDMSNNLDTGGSVANNALSFLLKSGFKNIAIIGQDLSYPEGKKHASEAELWGTNEVDTENSRYFEIPGYNGGMVVTEANMNIYRKWIEEKAKRSEGVDIYNATEGGAFIENTTKITLKDFIDKFCKECEDIDFVNIINSMKTHFTKEDIERKLEEIKGFEDNEIRALKEAIRDCKKQYEEFNKLNLAGKYNTRRFATVASNIMEAQSKIEQMDEMELIEDYNLIESWLITDEILDRKDTVYEENKDIYEKGIRTLESYEEAIRRFLVDYNEVKKEFGI